MINYAYLRAHKSENLKNREEAEFIKKEALLAQSFNNATILPLKRTDDCNLLFGFGGVIDENGSYIDISGIPGRVGGFYPFECTEIRNETVVYCGYFIKHWGHFLLESVSRLWYWFENDEAIDKYIFFVNEDDPLQFSGNYLRFLELLNIADKVEIINKPIQYRKVIVPELGYYRMHYYSDQYKKIFERVVLNALIQRKTIPEEKRIYFSRSHFKKALKSEIGIEFLDHYFMKNGFKILYPEELSLEEMITYIHNADICVTPSGTLPHNMLFAQDMKKTIIIERTALINEMQIDVDRIKDLDTTYIDGHWLIYPGLSGGGPFCYAYTRQFAKFTSDYKFEDPDRFYTSNNYHKKCLRNFIKTHKAFFGYDWGMEEWATIYAKEICEAHKETVEDLNEYITRRKPFLLKHYLQLHYIKRIIKRLMSFCNESVKEFL